MAIRISRSAATAGLPLTGNLSAATKQATICKVCRHVIRPKQAKEWRTNPMGLSHANPKDCK